MVISAKRKVSSSTLKKIGKFFCRKYITKKTRHRVLSDLFWFETFFLKKIVSKFFPIIFLVQLKKHDHQNKLCLFVSQSKDVKSNLRKKLFVNTLRLRLCLKQLFLIRNTSILKLAEKYWW